MRRAFPITLLVIPSPALAHLKWFEHYEVAQTPVPITTTLALPDFWLALVIVLSLFVATALLECGAIGRAATRALDAVTQPLHHRADDFVIAVLAAFFIVLFAIGGTYLTPELKTQSAMVPWAQLAIALLAIARRTRTVAALCIIALWVFALKDYDLFHLFDYLALGIGLAGFLLLSGLPEGTWHYRRFGVLRWGIALALMWSSMEKFMYPQWFMPLLEKKPFLALGIGFEPYTTMAGVAEFALGFGLLWSPLVRRLSAASLFVVMFAAVYPFGRLDLIGHAPMLAALLVVVADPLRDHALEIAPRDHRASMFVPAGFAAALTVTMVAYAGLHHLIYDRPAGGLAELLRPEIPTPAFADASIPPGADRSGEEHVHRREGASPARAATASAAMRQAMSQLHASMMGARITGDVDRDFAALMIPHHHSAVHIARIYLEAGRDPALRGLARNIIRSQQAEILQMQRSGPLRMEQAAAANPDETADR